MALGLITITNPNPRAVDVHQGARLVAVLATHDQVMVPYLDELRVSSPSGKAVIVCQVEEAGVGPTDEWVQEIGRRPAKPLPPPEPDRKT